MLLSSLVCLYCVWKAVCSYAFNYVLRIKSRHHPNMSLDMQHALRDCHQHQTCSHLRKSLVRGYACRGGLICNDDVCVYQYKPSLKINKLWWKCRRMTDAEISWLQCTDLAGEILNMWCAPCKTHTHFSDCNLVFSHITVDGQMPWNISSI